MKTLSSIIPSMSAALGAVGNIITPRAPKTAKVFIPALKREVTLTFQHSSRLQDGTWAHGLGCHFSWASDLGMYLTESNPEAVRYLNSPEWAGFDPKLTDELFREIASGFGRIRDHAENSYGPTPAGTPSGPTFVVMSDNINSYTPEFPKNSGIHSPTKIAKGFKTSDFVQWLVRNNHGIVVASPVGRNHWHQNSENFSLVQAWFWIPPNHAKFTAPGSHYISGLDQQPTWDGWYDDVRKTSGMSKRTNEEMDERMWKGGKRNSHLDALAGKGETKL